MGFRHPQSWPWLVVTYGAGLLVVCLLPITAGPLSGGAGWENGEPEAHRAATGSAPLVPGAAAIICGREQPPSFRRRPSGGRAPVSCGGPTRRPAALDPEEVGDDRRTASPLGTSDLTSLGHEA
jgi:hypothetical protein